MIATLFAMALYRPKPGKEQALKEVLEKHVPVLREEGLITQRGNLTLQAEDGTVIEIFEWASREAKDKAHQSPKVMEIWDEISSAAEMTSLSALPEAERPFPNFKSLDFRK